MIMKRIIQQKDITTIPADVLIYSTNVQLMLSGGVGSCLLEKCGPTFQENLYRQLDKSGRRFADVGEYFLSELETESWKLIIHTIATNLDYYTDEEIVRNLIRNILKLCRDRGLKTIVTSSLGAGYGDLKHTSFIKILTEEAKNYEGCITQITICCEHNPSYQELTEYGKLNGWELNQ